MVLAMLILENLSTRWVFALNLNTIEHSDKLPSLITCREILFACRTFIAHTILNAILAENSLTLFAHSKVIYQIEAYTALELFSDFQERFLHFICMVFYRHDSAIFSFLYLIVYILDQLLSIIWPC